MRSNKFFTPKKTFLFLLCVILFAVSPLTHAYWNYFETTYNTIKDQFSFTVSDYDPDGVEETPVTELPSYAPNYIYKRIAQLKNESESSGNPTEGELNLIIEGITHILEDPQFNFLEQHIFIAPTIDRLFDPENEIGKARTAGGDSMVYLVDGELHLVEIRANVNGSFNPVRDTAHLQQAFSTTWSNIQLHVPWLTEGTVYNMEYAPMLYKGNNKHYVVLNNDHLVYSPSQSPASSGNAWIEYNFPYAYDYVPTNSAYLGGAIVRHNGEYYIATGWASSAPPSSNWTLIPEYSSNVFYSTDNVVRVNDSSVEGGVRFFRASRGIANGSLSIVPSEQSARDGDWMELFPAWRNTASQMVHNHYLAHNVYRRGQIVVHGRFKNIWRFYEAIYTQNGGIVPADQPPTIRLDDGRVVVNSTYWRNVNTH